MRNLILLFSLFILIACDQAPVISPVTDPSGLALNGQGKAHLPDGSIYEGEFKDGLFYGEGALEWDNGTIYKGGFEKGLMHGKGKIKSKDRYIYVGEFQNGYMQGEGHFKSSNGQVYTGGFFAGDFSGRGKYTTYNGDTYEGEFELGRPNGEVTVVFKDGAKYTGGMKDWLYHGQGTYTIDNIAYSGQFIKGKLHGRGEIKRESGTYQGDIKNWLEEGTGKWHDNKGNEYEGEYQQGSYHGNGRFKFKNGDTYEGAFEHGLYHGKGKMHLAEPKGREKIRVGWWMYGNYVGKTKPDKNKRKSKPEYTAEEVMYRQPELLKTTLEALKPHQPGVTDLYFIAFAPDGKQDVFMNEALLSVELFNKNYNTLHRSISLITNKKTNKTIPIATKTSLKETLGAVSNIIDKDDDVLFLFLTSHGSENHELSVSMRGIRLQDLSAKDLKKYIDESGIKWRVIVVSACYSGGFIDYLKDPYTMVMTASSNDHVSFGCSDEAELTYFGRAFFKDSLTKSATFKEAFEKAKQLIAKREEKEGFGHSNPQIFIGDKIEEKLQRWRASNSLHIVYKK